MGYLGLAAMVGIVGLSACATTSKVPTQAAAAGCQALGDTGPAVGALFASGDVFGAQEARERPPVGRIGQYGPTVGADLYVHATPSTSEEYLERILVCHTAYGQPAHPNDPFHPVAGSVQAVSVRSSGSAYAVRLVGTDSSSSREILRRARALSTPGSVSVEQVAAAGETDESRL